MLSRPAPDSTMFALIKTFCAFCAYNQSHYIVTLLIIMQNNVHSFLVKFKKIWVSPKKLDHYFGPTEG